MAKWYIQKLEFYFRKTAIAKYIFSRKRTSVKGKFKVTSWKNLTHRLLAIADKSYRLYLTILVFVLIFVLLLYTFVSYQSITTFTYADDFNNQKVKVIDESRVSTIFLFVDDSKEGYLFIQMAFLLEADLKENTSNLYYIPNFYKIYNPGDDVNTIKSYLNTQPSLYNAIGGIERLLGIQIDRYVVLDIKKFRALSENQVNFSFLNIEDIYDASKYNSKDRLEFFSYYLNKSFSMLDLFKYIFKSKEITDVYKTDMSRGELVTLLRHLKGMSIRKIDLSPEGELNTDQTLIGIDSNTIFLDKEIQKYSKRLEIVAEQAEVEIYNASEISGFANLKKRQFQNAGISVVKTNNYFKTEDKNILYFVGGAVPEKFQNTFSFIRDNLEGDLEVRTEGYDSNFTGSMVLILGKTNK